MKSILMATLALALAGCVRTAPGAAADPSSTGASLVVDNRAAFEMTVYVIRGAQRVRLGQARALNTTTFRIPPDLVNGQALRFLADPIGSNRTPVSEEIPVWPGETIEIQIPPS